MIEADASRQRCVPGGEWQVPEAASAGVSVSPADPASLWTGANSGLAFFAYCTNYLIGLKHSVIVDVEATTAVRQAEATQQRMIDRRQERFGCDPGGWRLMPPTVRPRTLLG